MPQIITPQVLAAIFQGFSFVFNDALKGVTPLYADIAMDVPSSTTAENYGWLGQMPRMREWVGDRVVQSLNAYGYQIVNKTFETTIGVKREQIEDDQYGLFNPIFAELGRSVALFPDELCFPLLSNGWTNLCYDGQPFFSSAHPVLDANGNLTTASNQSGGAPATPATTPAWFLIDKSRALKPIIHQKRRPFEFVSKTSEQSSDLVYQRNEFLYSVDGRVNAGYALWQLAYGSTAALTRPNFRAAYEAMITLRGDYGRPLGIVPTEIWVGPSSHMIARDLFETDFLPVDGAPGEAALSGAVGMIANADKGLVKVRMTPWLP